MSRPFSDPLTRTFVLPIERSDLAPRNFLRNGVDEYLGIHYVVGMTKTRFQSKPRTTAARNALIDAIRGRESFTTSGSLSGVEYLEGEYDYPDCGRLESSEYNAWKDQRGEILYAVLSYTTPIAWYTPEGWHIVSQRFSVTTGAQQSIVRRAVGSMSFRADEAGGGVDWDS